MKLPKLAEMTRDQLLVLLEDAIHCGNIRVTPIIIAASVWQEMADRARRMMSESVEERQGMLDGGFPLNSEEYLKSAEKFSKGMQLMEQAQTFFNAHCMGNTQEGTDIETH